MHLYIENSVHSEAMSSLKEKSSDNGGCLIYNL